jgi:ATP-binding cassette subfamily C (CFTR/MRP) protein 1
MVHRSVRTTASIPSAGLGIIAAACITSLLHFEHTRSVRPSSILSMYFLFSALLDLPMLRTFYLRGDPLSITASCAIILLLKIALLLLETWPKKAIFRPPYQHLSPEETSGIINRSFLWWLVGLHRLASRGFIKPDDLYQLDHELSSDFLSERISLLWKHRSIAPALYLN